MVEYLRLRFKKPVSPPDSSDQCQKLMLNAGRYVTDAAFLRALCITAIITIWTKPTSYASTSHNLDKAKQSDGVQFKVGSKTLQFPDFYTHNLDKAKQSNGVQFEVGSKTFQFPDFYGSIHWKGGSDRKQL